MMIDVIQYSRQVEKTRNDIKEYETTIYDVISNIKNLTFYWNDGYTKSFFKKIDKLAIFTNDFANCLYNFLTLMTFLSTKYNLINKKANALFNLSNSIIKIDDYIVTETDDEVVASKKEKYTI